MTAPSHATATDQTDIPLIVRASIKLGLIQTVIIVLMAIVSRGTEGPLEAAGLAGLLLVGLAVSVGLPGIWTNARTIEGIAGAAGIGLAASAVFLVIDAGLLQPLGLWTNRWREIGGGSNWWYHPIWWMVDAFLGWMGAWVLAPPGGAGPAAIARDADGALDRADPRGRRVGGAVPFPWRGLECAELRGRLPCRPPPGGARLGDGPQGSLIPPCRSSGSSSGSSAGC